MINKYRGRSGAGHFRKFCGLKIVVALCAVTLAAALPIAGASAGNPKTSAGSIVPPKVASIASLVPKAIRERGTLRVADLENFTPLTFTSAGGKLVGYDPDLINAIAAVLGLKAKITSIPFEDIIPGLQAGRYDVGQGEYFISPPRLKAVDFVTDWSDGNGVLIQKASTLDITSLLSLCGLNVAVQAGSIEETNLQTEETSCTSAGKGQINVQAFPDQNQIVLSLTSGRSDAALGDDLVNSYSVKQGLPLKVTYQYGFEVTATAVSKNGELKGAGHRELDVAIKDALQYMIAHGYYAKIGVKWNTTFGNIKASQIEINPHAFDPTTGALIPYTG